MCAVTAAVLAATLDRELSGSLHLAQMSVGTGGSAPPALGINTVMHVSPFVQSVLLSHSWIVS